MIYANKFTKFIQTISLDCRLTVGNGRCSGAMSLTFDYTLKRLVIAIIAGAAIDGELRQLYSVEQRHRHSSCADEPFTTPPPGLVAEAKFSTHTRYPIYFAAASNERLRDTTTFASLS